MSDSNFSIVAARDLVSDLNNIQVFLECAPEDISSEVITELNTFQHHLIGQLEIMLAGISRGDGVSPC